MRFKLNIVRAEKELNLNQTKSQHDNQTKHAISFFLAKNPPLNYSKNVPQHKQTTIHTDTFSHGNNTKEPYFYATEKYEVMKLFFIINYQTRTTHL